MKITVTKSCFRGPYKADLKYNLYKPMFFSET